MKKFITLCCLTGLLCACTSKEQDEQARSFWAQQLAYAVAAFSPNKSLPANTPVSPKQANPQEDMQEFEDMMKQWEKTQNSLDQQETLPSPKPAPDTAPAQETETTPATPTSAPTVKTAPKTPATAKKTTSTAKTAKPLNAYLVTSAQCGWCRKLKQERWPEKFQDTYRGQVRLIEYDVTTPEGQAGYTKLMRRYKLSSVGTPSLFIGDSVVRGYPLAEADNAVQKALAKYGKNISRPSSGQFMEITMEDPSGSIRGKAPLKDRQAMQRAIDKVLQENQTTLQDIGQMFGASTQAEAFAITTKTEKALRRQASASASLQEYLQAQRQLLAQQEQSLNQLMKNNAKFLRNIH